MEKLISLNIGDLHEPFSLKEAKKEVFKRAKRLKKAGFSPKYIIQHGDAHDRYSNNRFGKGFWIDPQAEDMQAREAMEQFWLEIIKIFPRASCYQVSGNHEKRGMDRIIEKSPDHMHMVREYLKELMTYPGVSTIHDYREELVLDGVVHIHGHRAGLGDHMKDLQRSVICGHSHRGGVVFYPVNGETLFEANCGFLGDRNHPALSYTSYKKFTKWTLGYVERWSDGPRFIGFNERDFNG